MDVEKWTINLWGYLLTFNPINSNAVYLPTTQYFPTDVDKFREVLTFVYSDIARRLNDKEIALYDLVELLNGQQWFDPNNTQIKRQDFRKVFQIGAIGAGATLVTAHGITGFSTLTFTRIYGTIITAAATFNQRLLPYVDVTNITNQVSIDADTTNFRIINGVSAPNIVSALVVLEYLKN